MMRHHSGYHNMILGKLSIQLSVIFFEIFKIHPTIDHFVESTFELLSTWIGCDKKGQSRQF